MRSINQIETLVVLLAVLGCSHGFRPVRMASSRVLRSNTNKLNKSIMDTNLLGLMKVCGSEPMALRMSSSESSPGGLDISRWLSFETRGGVIVWGTILITIPIAVYYYFVGTGVEETRVGAYVGALFVLLSMLAWASTYIFRVATKDMTYARQLRDYENAVLQKRLDELADDEIQALMEEIDNEENTKPSIIS
eukprot:gene6519-13174_t